MLPTLIPEVAGLPAPAVIVTVISATPPAPTTAVREALSSPSISNRASPTGLSHPEDLSERAAQLAARARELRNSVEVANSDTLDDNFQHAKLQNMYLASMQTTLDAIANTK